MGVELAPVEAMLDEIHPPLPTRRDHNSYTLGRLGAHNIVVAVLPQIGNNAAVATTIHLTYDFPSIRFGLLVGIGGGVPGREGQQLGDVVVSQPRGITGGIIQYDMGTTLLDNFRRTGMLNKPPAVLMANVEKLKAQHRREGCKIGDLIADMIRENPSMAEYKFPGRASDILFDPLYEHVGGHDCSQCDESRVLHRDLRADEHPQIHYGIIGSANSVLRDGQAREKLRNDLDILAVEMEGAGTFDSLPCLVIRGICDYSDSHKNKSWQPYAAAAAAGYMKELLLLVPPREQTVTPPLQAVKLAANQAGDADVEEITQSIGDESHSPRVVKGEYLQEVNPSVPPQADFVPRPRRFGKRQSQASAAASYIDDVFVSADGQHGVQQHHHNSGGQLVTYSGRFNGADALPSRDGTCAGTIKAEIQTWQGGGFEAKLANKPAALQVPIGSNLYLSARGGDGENGGVGGDGQDGSTGTRGTDATQYREATCGGNGGNGGNGGRGSNGGHGGNGGTVEVRVSEHHMHLAYAVEWNVRGGSGGRAGLHGSAGAGGRGGRGGRGFSWKEFDGYRQVCAPDCSYGSSSALTRSKGSGVGSLNSNVPWYLAVERGAISDGTNAYSLNNVVARIPAEHTRLLQGALGDVNKSQALVPAASGGHAAGCRKQPTYKTRSRPAAADGMDGCPGTAHWEPLLAGRHGNPGHGYFVVFDPYAPLADTIYDSKFAFELEKFDVIDENDDGVFEPGECIILSKVRIRNANNSARGMPTPVHTEIPTRMKSNTWLASIEGSDELVLPCDIAPGTTKTTTDGVIKAMIQHPPESLLTNQIFTVVQPIGVYAMIPDLDRLANGFNYQKTISIRYPLFLEPSKIIHLDSIPVGASSLVKWQVGNCSSTALGDDSHSRRQVKTSIDTSSQKVVFADSLVPVPSMGIQEAIEFMDRIEAHGTRDFSKRLMLDADAEEYSTISLLVRLHATPITTSNGPSLSSPTLIPMQTQEISIQVTNRYKYNPDAQLLILTSRSTTKAYLDKWRHFLRTELHIMADVWNVSQHGGMTSEDNPDGVLRRYSGKTILALDDSFSLLTNGRRTVLDFIDVNESSKLARAHTSFHFAKQHLDTAEHAKLMIHQIAAAGLGVVDEFIHSKAERVLTRKELFASLDNRIDHDVGAIIVDCPSQQTKNGRRLARRLRRLYPRDRFLVTDAMDGAGLIVIHCTPQGQSFGAFCNQTKSKSGSRPRVSGVSSAEAYALISAMPFKLKLDMLLGHVTKQQTCSDFVLLATKCSVMQELHEQITNLASRPRWSHNMINFDQDQFSTKSLLGEIHDKVAALLKHDLCKATNTIGTQGSDMSKIACDILSSLILSARCQNSTQLLTKLFNPFKRTRSHIKRGLINKVEEVIRSFDASQGNASSEKLEARLKNFRRSCRQPLRDNDRKKRLDREAALLTTGQKQSKKQSISIELSTQAITVDTFFAKSKYVSPAELREWQKRGSQIEDRQRRDRQSVIQRMADVNLQLHDGNCEILPRETVPKETVPAVQLDLMTAACQELPPLQLPDSLRDLFGTTWTNDALDGDDLLLP